MRLLLLRLRRYGFIVDDIVGAGGQVAAGRMAPRFLLANAAFFAHMALIMGLLGTNSAVAGRMGHLALALIVKALFLVYIAAAKPYVSMVALLGEGVASFMEIVVMLVAVADVPAIVTITLLLVQFIQLVAVEALRLAYTVHALSCGSAGQQ